MVEIQISKFIGRNNPSGSELGRLAFERLSEFVEGQEEAECLLSFKGIQQTDVTFVRGLLALTEIEGLYFAIGNIENDDVLSNCDAAALLMNTPMVVRGDFDLFIGPDVPFSDLLAHIYKEGDVDSVTIASDFNIGLTVASYRLKKLYHLSLLVREPRSLVGGSYRYVYRPLCSERFNGE